MEYCCTTQSQAQTEALAGRMAAALFPGAFLVLSGELGAGKTAFVRGLAEGLGLTGVCSPTFTIVQEYLGVLPLYHFDAYRLDGGEALWEIGFEEYLRGGGVICMEWPELVEEALPQERLEIYITGSGNTPRGITLCARGQAYVPLLQAVKEGSAC